MRKYKSTRRTLSLGEKPNGTKAAKDAAQEPRFFNAALWILVFFHVRLPSERKFIDPFYNNM